jgi:Tol biopolymer transport system component
MIGDDGRVKVLDFGLAKLKETDASLAASLPTQELTGEGRIVGTVAYMSPEQAEAKPVDPRSDVFSLGVVIFEMATSQRPFKGDTQLSLLSSIIKDTPSSLAELKADLPRDLARIVRRCLSKDPEDRYQTAKDLRNDLRALKEDLSSGVVAAGVSDVHALPAAPGAAAKRRYVTVAVAGIAALSVAGAAFVYWSGNDRQPGAASPANAQLFASVSLTRLTTTGTAGRAAISDDGRYVAYVATENGKSRLWLRQVATTSNVAIVPAADVRFNGVTFSPDGNYVYYSFYPAGELYGSLWQVPALGGGARRVLDDVDADISFDPSGNRFAMVRGIATTQETALIVVDTNGYKTKTLVTRKAPNRFKFQSVAWSPDGRSIAALAERGEDLQVDVVLIDALTGHETVLGNHAWRDATYVAWLPDGKSLLVNAQEANGEATNQVWLVSASGEPRRVTNDLSRYAGLSLTADGKSFVSVRSELRSRVWIVDAAGGEPRVVSSGAGADDGVNGLAWTADGRLVYTSASAGNLDIWLMDADGRNRVPLTSDKAHDSWPVVTPDGRRIVFVSERGGARGLWVMGTDGSEQRRIGSVTVNPEPGLSADDKWAYFTAAGGRNFRIGIDGGEPVPLEVSAPARGAAAPLPEAFHEPVSSPDGRMIAGALQLARGARGADRRRAARRQRAEAVL